MEVTPLNAPAFEVTLTTPTDVANGIKRGDIMFAHSPTDEKGLFFYTKTPDSTDGYALYDSQVARRDHLDQPYAIEDDELGADSPVADPAQTELFTEVVDSLVTMASTNPKDRIGRAKVDLSLIPAAGMIHEAHAFMDGANKYGPYNWRGNSVAAMVYIAAAMRHMQNWINGEEVASDSLAHHLGHAKACLSIIIDAQHVGKLVDDRPPPADVSGLLAELNATIVSKKENN